MQVSPVDLAFARPLQPAWLEDKQENNSVSFAEMLNNSLKELSSTKSKADALTVGFFTGEVQDFHQVAIAMQESSLTMQLAIEVRNKVVEAYQEISRMQI